MSISTSLACPDRSLSLRERLADVVELTRPKIAVLELVTVAVAAVVATWGHPDLAMLGHALAGTALVAASASALNQYLERAPDRLMARTADRPLPSGRIAAWQVVAFGVVAAIAGVAWLAAGVGPTVAVLGLASWALYVWVYTPLKLRSISNTVVGAVAGALPVLMGWFAGGGDWGLAACTLFLIVFLWQFPHFMAIAWIYRDDYARAGMKMLSVVDPTGGRAGRQAVLAALVLIPVSLLPGVVQFAGPAYMVWACVLGFAQAACALVFYRRRTDQSARLLLRASLVYLPGLFMGLLVGPLVS